MSVVDRNQLISAVHKAQKHRLRRPVAVVITLVMGLGLSVVSAGVAHGATAVGGINYTINAGTMTVKVDKYSPGPIPASLTIPSAVTIGGLSYAVTDIGQGAFASNLVIAGVTLPDSVVTVGVNAFKDSSLTSINLGQGLVSISANAFYGTKLTSVVLPNSLRNIDTLGFGEVRTLASLDLGNGLETLGGSSFSGVNLTSIRWGATLKTIGPGAFSNVTASLGAVTLPNSLQSLGAGALTNMRVTTVTFGAAVTSLGSKAITETAGGYFTAATFTGPPPTVLGVKGSVDQPLSSTSDVFVSYLPEYSVADGYVGGFVPSWKGYTTTIVDTVPDAPTAVVGQPADGQASVSWAAPANNGGHAITGYVVTTSPGDTTTTTDVTTTATITGLANGTSYTFTVAAVNSRGTSLASSPSPATVPALLPSVPTGVSAVAGDAQVRLTWIPPVSDGGSAVTSYTVTRLSAGLDPVSTRVTSSPSTVTGLTNGRTYTFTVTATNPVGSSSPSSASAAVTPGRVPSAPTGVTASPGNTQAVVTWVEPDNGGLAITEYVVRASPGTVTKTVSSGTSATVTGLTNGTTYTFTVTATNALGSSAASVASTGVVVATVPGAPSAVVASAGNASATIAWEAPASTGGSAITGYTISSTVGGFTPVVVGAVLTTSITGLTNGTSYTFTVTATNARGVSATSSPTATIVPSTTPDAPTSVMAAAGNTSATVVWSAPSSNGGAAVTGYSVTSSPGGFTAVSVGGATTATVIGLTNGTSYTFSVTATNVRGVSTASVASAAVVPAAVPGAPTAVVAIAGDASVTLDWVAPANTGGSVITGYTISSPVAGFVSVTVGDVVEASVTGLTNGTSYTFTVTATNIMGTSAAATGSRAVTPSRVATAPTTVLATAGNRHADVSWTAPTDNGGAAITGYTVTSSPGGFTADSVGAATTAVVTGLTNGVSYTFTVTATNLRGASEASTASASITPATTPSAPTGVAAVAGDATATLSWEVPASAGGLAVTGYTISSSVSGFSTVTVGVVTSTILSGLINGTSYEFTVAAINGVGTSTASVSSTAVMPQGAPVEPRDVVAVPGDRQVTVSWDAPLSDGGSAITSYTVTASPGGSTASVANVTTARITGLTNGTFYTFTVTATNILGTSPVSIPSAAIPAGSPTVPQAVSVTAGNEQATLSWSAPESDSGSAITGYTISSSTPGFVPVTVGVSLTATVVGLTNGTNYSFSITAMNVMGSSVASEATPTVVPSRISTAPRDVTGVAGDSQATVSWTAPADNGGAAISVYTVTASPGSRTVTTTDETTVVFPGLINGTDYSFTVTATNVRGTSVASVASATVIPGTVPSAPLNALAVSGNGQVALSWAAPATEGASVVTEYTITSSVVGFVPVTVGPVLATTVTGLTNGTSYSFAVTATNAIGDSVASRLSTAVVPSTLPSAPFDARAVAGNTQATVSWVAPADDGGAAVTGYTVTSSPGDFTGVSAGSATTATVTGLINGLSYTFTVTATNVRGASVMSSASSAVTLPRVPGAPTAVEATAGDGTVTLVWVAPREEGGSTITGYTVSSSAAGIIPVTLGLVTSTIVAGLVNGTSYTFTVTAINAEGASFASLPSPAVVPLAVLPPAEPSAGTGPNAATLVAPKASPVAIPSPAARELSDAITRDSSLDGAAATAASEDIAAAPVEGNPLPFFAGAAILILLAGASVTFIRLRVTARARRP